MKISNFLWLPAFLLAAHDASAYGSSGGSSSSRKICDKTALTEFTPADKSDVIAGSDFSFKASNKINPDRIRVTVKNQAVDMTVIPDRLGYQVRGKLPESLQGTYARISISAEGVDKCQADAGWLVNIAE